VPVEQRGLLSDIKDNNMGSTQDQNVSMPSGQCVCMHRVIRVSSGGIESEESGDGASYTSSIVVETASVRFTFTTRAQGNYVQDTLVVKGTIMHFPNQSEAKPMWYTACPGQRNNVRPDGTSEMRDCNKKLVEVRALSFRPACGCAVHHPVGLPAPALLIATGARLNSSMCMYPNSVICDQVGANGSLLF